MGIIVFKVKLIIKYLNILLNNYKLLVIYAVPSKKLADTL